MIVFGGQSHRSGDWAWFKALVLRKNLSIQYEEDVARYVVYAYDGFEIISCQIWKSTLNNVGSNYSQFQNDFDLIDFETYYKDAANQQIIAAVDPIPSGTATFDKWDAEDSSFSLSTSWQSVYALTCSHVFLGCAFKVNSDHGIHWRMLINGMTVFDERLDRLDDLGLLHAESSMGFKNPLEGRFHFIPPEGGIAGTSFDIQFKKAVNPAKTIEYGRTWRRKR